MRSKVSEKQTVCVSVNGEDLQDVNPILSTAPAESRGKASQYVGTDARRRSDRDKDLLSHRTDRLSAKLYLCLRAFRTFVSRITPLAFPQPRGHPQGSGMFVLGCSP